MTRRDRIETTRTLTQGRGSLALVAMMTAVLLLLSGRSGSARQDVRAPQIGRIDFMAVTKDGQPVADLRLEDVVLRIDGKIRPLRTLNFVRMSEGLNAAAMAAAAAGTPGAASGPSPAPANADIALPFVMNLTPPLALARSIILMVDDETMPIGEEQRLRATLTRFVRSLPDQDQVSLVTVPHGGVVVGLTTDREKLAKGIATLAPITPIEEPACRSKTMLGVLQTTMDRLIAQRGNDQPVVVAFLSASLTGISVGEQAQRATISGAGGVSAQAGACAIRPDDFVKIGQAQANARVTFYVIHPDYSPTPVLEGIESLRAQTGAPLLHLTSSGEPGLNRMARETSGYYLATFDTVPDELTGKPHNSAITLTRKDVVVRDRPFLIVGKDVPSPSAIVRPDAATGTITTAYDMVRSGRPFRELPMRGTAWSARNSKVPTAIDVIAAFEPIDPNTKVMQAAAALFDENGVAQAYWPADPAQAAMSTWPATIGLTVKPGTYRLRIGAIDDKGHTGLIDQPVVAELQKAGPLQLGGLSLGVSRPNGFVTRLLFTTEATAIAMFDLYGGQAGETQIQVVFEVARTTDGPAIMTVNAAASPTQEDGKFVVTGAISVGALQAGDYVVRAVVTVAGQGSGRVYRTLRKG